MPLEVLVRASFGEIADAVLKLAENIWGNFAVRAKVRGGNKKLSQRELEVKLGSLIVEHYNMPVNLSNPDYTVVVEVLGKKAGVGVLKRGGEILRFEVEE